MSEKDPSFHNSSSSLDNLRVISYCPLCNTHYNPSEAKVLEEKDGAHLIHVECGKCHSSIVAVIITGGIGVSSVGLITDLTSGDVTRFKNQDSVTEDDVIEAYESIKSEDFIKMLIE
jgi:hypothetical protein|tara:strand:- start:719 stop:1069 length:351 start_codon:yes stop_codon:yes gene_type:complete